MTDKKKEKAKKPSKKEIKQIEEMAVELLGLMGTDSKATAEYNNENEAVVVSVDAGDEAGLIIGNRGRTLNSIQTVLGMMNRGRTGDWRRILVDVADWREKEEERLAQLAKQSAQRALDSGEPQYLYNLTPSQRRLVHMALTSNKEVVTESHGEGSERYLVVSPK